MTELWTQRRALCAIIARNLRMAVRRPDLVVQTIVVPLVVLGLASIIFGATDAWPVAVVDHSKTPASDKVIEAIADTRGATGPYFRIVETDPENAKEQVGAGRLHLVVTIPDDFATSRTIETITYNINTDAMKNVRLRLATMANLYDSRVAGLSVTNSQLTKERPSDVTRSSFMGGSAVILALLLGSALIAANLYAVDHERRTTKEIALTPLGSHLSGIGAMLTGWLLAPVAALPTVGLAAVMGTRTTWASLIQAAVIVLPSALAAGGFGVACAALLRSHSHIQPIIILLALGSYFASGGFIPVPSLPPLARDLATWWPSSYVFEWANSLLHGFSSSATAAAVGSILGAALAGAALAAWAGHREPARAHRQGQ